MRPRWRTVYEYFRVWKQDGTWLRIHDYLHGELRVEMKREKQPSAGIVDSPTVKTTEKGGRERGSDGGKKIAGRKRHIVVDTTGLVIRAVVH